MNRRSFLSMLCAVVVAPLVAVSVSAAPATTFSMHLSIDGVTDLCVGSVVSISTFQSSEVLRVVGVHHDGSYTVVRG